MNDRKKTLLLRAKSEGMNQLYPLKFRPVFKEKVWGGQKIKQHLGLDFTPLPNCGEAWVISGVEGNESVVKDGWLKGNSINELVSVFMDDLVGEKVFETHRHRFPVLIKFIDSNQWLSIQVHPDDKLAQNRHGSTGKTEMWYVLNADAGAQLISGFNRHVTTEEYLGHLRNNTLPSIMNFVDVAGGDVFYMPAGRVHALGPGILLAEIQQTSDITYRIYDWDRVDESGNSRELHTELALDAIDFRPHLEDWSRSDPDKDKPMMLKESKYFTTRLLNLVNSFVYQSEGCDSFVIYLCIEGEAHVLHEGNTIRLSAGECLLVPAIIRQLTISPKPHTVLLEVYCT